MTAYSTIGGYGLALAAMLIASAACAEETVVSLSPAAKERALNEAADRNVSAIGEPAINGLGVGAGIHGEVGMMIGTGGARGVFGSATAPIGQDGWMSFAFENSQYGRHR